MNDKVSIRKKITTLRRSLPTSAKLQADTIIMTKVLHRPEVRRAKIICVYESYPTEVNTRQLIQELIKRNKIVVPPEPPPCDVDVYIIPGVAFDINGNRLGRGGGYYDRILAGKNVPVIGLAYKCQIVSRLPHELYDIPVTVVIYA